MQQRSRFTQLDLHRHLIQAVILGNPEIPSQSAACCSNLHLWHPPTQSEARRPHLFSYTVRSSSTFWPATDCLSLSIIHQTETGALECSVPDVMVSSRLSQILLG
ncbi:hypothetical protein QCA50_007791 [Cerrena zonata]|uniref:Uncharacterized protein n=1 Tax=Cerrena zonata TaxID=2478898 RepID=A0AAW0G6M3_9APHY